MSIRFDSGGHSFSMTLPSRAEGESVEAMLLTTRAMLIPSEMLRTSQRDFTPQLSEVGIYVDAQRDKVVTIWGDVISALVVVPLSLDETLNDHYNDNFEYMTPLLLERADNRVEERFVIVERIEEVLALRAFDSSQLRFADIYEVEGEEELLYRLLRVSESLKLSAYTFILYGCSDKEYSLINLYFKNVQRCE
ncbi:MAG: hypothetical protein SNH28_05710 [Rikenellaceae bacterium]